MTGNGLRRQRADRPFDETPGPQRALPRIAFLPRQLTYGMPYNAAALSCSTFWSVASGTPAKSLRIPVKAPV